MKRAHRRFVLWLVVSVLAHLGIFLALPKPKHSLDPGAAAPPMTVRITTPDVVAEVVPTPPTPTPPPPPPVPRPTPRPAEPTILATPKASTTPAVPPQPPVEPPPREPSVAAPAMDMLAMIEARRAGRQAQIDALRQQNQKPPPPDAATKNLQTLTGREGVSGVFTIMRIGTRTGEFSFNGWRQDARGQWREVIEVDAGLGGSVELAMVKRMISLIRNHYHENFNWESHRLGRVVVLSARLEDNDGLEEFLMKEFFGQPMVRQPPPRQAQQPPPSRQRSQ